ncbi:MAG: DUF2318 domain-containing protein [Desulfobacterales bacterium]|nr:DUF2318 domain-containing protein [Desulfobacterales bacterium]
MSKKNPRKSTSRRAEKKAAVLGSEKKNRLALVATIVSGLLFAGAIGAYLIQADRDADPSAKVGTRVPVEAGQVVLAADIFDDGEARHYEYQSGGLNIRYFVLKSSDGVIRAAFDACDVCWPAGKGYYQDGDVMVCRNCGKRFASVLVNEVKGGCNPAPLDRRIENGRVMIPVAAIEAGSGYFNFSKGV